MKRVNLSWVVVIIVPAMILVQSPRMSGAFVASDMQSIPPVVSTLLTIITAISGAGLGVLFTAGQTVLFDGWKRGLPTGERKMSNRMKALTAVIVGVLVIECMILAPYIVSRVTGQTMAEVAGRVYVWIWAIATVAAPTLIVAGVMLSNATDAPQNASAKVQDATQAKTDAAQMRNDAVQDKIDLHGAVTYPVYKCKACGEYVRNPGSHARWECSARKARKDAR